jgi:hypothetical protein
MKLLQRGWKNVLRGELIPYAEQTARLSLASGKASYSVKRKRDWSRSGGYLDG